MGIKAIADVIPGFLSSNIYLEIIYTPIYDVVISNTAISKLSLIFNLFFVVYL